MLLINYGHKARLYYVELPLPRVLLYNRNCLKTLLTNSSPRQVSDCRSKLQKYFSQASLIFAFQRFFLQKTIKRHNKNKDKQKLVVFIFPELG